MTRGTAESYRVFVRNWWKHARPGSHFYPGLEPDGGARKTTLGRGCTEAEAQRVARAYNDSHKPGRLSRKAEYERE